MVANERLLNERLNVGRKLAVQSSHSILHKAAQSLDHAIFAHEFGQQAVNKWPQLDKKIRKRIYLRLYAGGKRLQPLKEISKKVKKVLHFIYDAPVHTRHLTFLKVIRATLITHLLKRII